MAERQTVDSPRAGGLHSKHGLIVWLAWLTAAVLAGVGLRHYRIDNDMSQWLPDLGAVGAMQSYVVVGFEREAIEGRALAKQLQALSAVAFCIDSATVEASGQQLGVTADDFVVSRDGSYEGIFVFRGVSATDEQLVGQVTSVLAALGDRGLSQVHLAGPAVFHLALNQASQRRLPAIMLLIIAVGGGLLRWVTGSASVALAAVGAITLSQIVLVGTTSWLRLPMDVALSIVPPMMMSFGFSYAAHRALRPHVTGLLALCAATTALGIVSFAFAGLAPIRTFAISGVFGLALAWVAVITLVPGPRTDRQPGRPDQDRLPRMLRLHLHLVQRRPRAMILIGAAITVVALVAVGRLRFETDPLNYFPPTDRVVRDFAALNQRLTGMLSSQVTVDTDADPTALLQNTPGVRKVIDVSRIVDDGRRHFWCLADNDAMPTLITLEQSLGEWAQANQAQFRWRGVAARLAQITKVMGTTAAIALPTMGLVAAISVGFLTRSALLAAISVWVNLLPVGVLVLVVTGLNWALGLPSLMIGAIAVGLAIDDTIHVAMGLRRMQSTVRTITACWRPCAGSTLVAAACLMCFALSPFEPTRQFGVLLALAAVAALLADLILLLAIRELTRTPKRLSCIC